MQQPEEKSMTTEITEQPTTYTARSARLRILKLLEYDPCFTKAFNAIENQASGNLSNLSGNLVIKIRKSSIKSVSVEFNFEG